MSVFNYDRFYKSYDKTDEYGAVNTITSLDKNELAKFVTGLSKEQLVTILKNVKVEIETVLENTSA